MFYWLGEMPTLSFCWRLALGKPFLVTLLKCCVLLTYSLWTLPLFSLSKFKELQVLVFLQHIVNFYSQCLFNQDDLKSSHVHCKLFCSLLILFWYIVNVWFFKFRNVPTIERKKEACCHCHRIWRTSSFQKKKTSSLYLRLVSIT